MLYLQMNMLVGKDMVNKDNDKENVLKEFPDWSAEKQIAEYQDI